MDFLAFLHSLSYQELVVLLFFLYDTLKENLLIEVERVVVLRVRRFNLLKRVNRSGSLKVDGKR
jgi:hypothetical protein